MPTALEAADVVANSVFHIKSGVMKAAVGEGDQPIILVTASSTEVDLEGDRFIDSALKEMQSGFVGLTIFLNHEYAVPECVFGTVLKAYLVKRDGFTDLDLEVAVCKESTRAMETYSMIKNGIRLGVSVGVMVDDVNKTDEKYRGRNVIEIGSTIPLEASVVGIPANRRSWVQDAIVGLVERGVLEMDEQFVTDRPWFTKAWNSRARRKAAVQEEDDMATATRTKKSSKKGDQPDAAAVAEAEKVAAAAQERRDTVRKGIVDGLQSFKLAGAETAENFDQHLADLSEEIEEQVDTIVQAHDEPESTSTTTADEHEADADKGEDKKDDKDEKACCGNDGADGCCMDADGNPKEADADKGEGKKSTTPTTASATPEIALDAFSEELAKRGFWTNYYKASWALDSVLYELMDTDDLEPAAKIGAMAAATASFNSFITAAFTDAVNAAGPVGDDMNTAGIKAAGELVAKLGARNNTKDKEAIQTVHDSSVTLGATCDSSKDDADDEVDDDALEEITASFRSTSERLEKALDDKDRMERDLATTGEIVEQLLQLPLARKAVVNGETIDVDELKARLPFYDDSIVKRLARTSTTKA